MTTTTTTTPTTTTECCCSATKETKTPTLTDNEKARLLNHKSQGQSEFFEHLASQRGCYTDKENLNGDYITSSQEKSLPIIDLFLNPDRQTEKEAVLERAHKEEAGSNHTKVKSTNLYIYKGNRCLARYSPRAKTTSQPINRAPNEPAMVRNANFGLNLVVFEQKILFLLEKSKVLLPT